MERAQRSPLSAYHRGTWRQAQVAQPIQRTDVQDVSQYAMELMTLTPGPSPKGRGETPAPGLFPKGRKGEKESGHFFGFTQVSELHTKTIGWLGQFFDIRFYHLNLLANRLQETPEADSLRQCAAAYRDAGGAGDDDYGGELLRSWGRSGAESLWRAADVLANPGFRTQRLPNYEPAKATEQRTTKRSASVLGATPRPLAWQSPERGRLNQDTSLQIVGCAGVAREVETVYNSVLHNLHNDPAAETNRHRRPRDRHAPVSRASSKLSSNGRRRACNTTWSISARRA